MTSNKSSLEMTKIHNSIDDDPDGDEEAENTEIAI